MLLSANKEVSHHPENTELAAIFNFSPEDLQANRDGKISPSQIKILKRGAENERRFLGCFLLLPLGAVLFLVAVNMLGLESRQGNNIPILAAFVLLSVYGVWVTLSSKRRKDREIKDRVALSITGRMRPYRKARGIGAAYFAEIGSKSFFISLDNYLALKSHLNNYSPDEYTAYYAPRTNKLLSVEVTQ